MGFPRHLAIRLFSEAKPRREGSEYKEKKRDEGKMRYSLPIRETTISRDEKETAMEKGKSKQSKPKQTKLSAFKSSPILSKLSSNALSLWDR